jgi:PAS domain S-box-containing protein
MRLAEEVADNPTGEVFSVSRRTFICRHSAEAAIVSNYQWLSHPGAAPVTMSNPNLSENIFVGNSEMAALMRALDWSQTPLGAVETWSQSLKTAVRIMITSRQAMFVWWGDKLINLYNDAYRSILGGKHPEALGQPAEVVWREIWEQVGPRAETALRENQGTYDEALLLIMERNGYPEETYYTFSYSPVPDDDGSNGGIICANTEDTPRIIGERQLALLKELAAKTADARTFDQACTLSANCLAANTYDLPFAMIYLVDADRDCAVLAGTSGIDRGHPLAPETVTFEGNSIWSFAEVIESHRVHLISHLETKFADIPSGPWQRSPHQAAVVPIAPSGQTGKAGILVVGLNPFRLFDDQYQRFVDLVSAQISASIANAQTYEEERKRAEALAELDRAKTAFFSNVSHEFRTPLTLMISPLEELSNTLDGRLHPDEREQLQLVQRNGLRLQKLVNTLLDFSRIEAGRVQASFEPTDLAAYTAELASVFRSLVERAGMELIIDCPPLPEAVYVDREMWEKVVLNLISNAFKFTFTGSITVRLQVVNHSVELSVADTGVGIPAAELPRLFERFHRVSGARSRTYEGSGIGLALVQELVKLHGGTIGVTSQVDQGTTFTIVLPFGSAHLPGDRIKAPRALASTAVAVDSYLVEASRWLPEEDRADGGNGGDGEDRGEVPAFSLSPSSLTTLSASPTQLPPARILLVDDNADMRDYVKRLLNQYWQVEAVANGRLALEAIARQMPDLVLSDVMMPELDGFGLLRELRTHPQTQDIPVILLSARAGEEARIEGLAAGADDYLIKPFSARELLARVEATLKLAKLRRDAAQKEQTLRVEAETAKHEAELAYDRINDILECMTDAFVAFDRQWRYTYVNPAALQLLQKSPEELIGKNVWEEVFPEEVGKPPYQRLQQVMEERVPLFWEEFGEPIQRWLEVRAYPSTEGVAVYFQDISDRKQAEADLKAKSAELQHVTETVEVGLTRCSYDLRYLSVNPAYARLTGVAVEEIVGRPVIDVIGEPALEVIRPYIERVLNGERIGYEAEVPFAVGGARYIHALYMPDEDADGNIMGWIAAVVDITERKQAEEELQESKEQLRMATESANLGMWYWDGATDKLNWSEVARRMFGIPADVEMTMKVFLEAIHPDDLPFIRSVMRDLEVGQLHPEIEYRICWADGTVRWILARGDSSYNADGTLTSTQGVLMDITERKQAEAEIQALNLALTHRVNELQALFDLLPMGVAISEDPDCQTIRVNPYLSRLLRVPMDENASQSASPEERPTYRIFKEKQEIPVDDLPMQYAALHNTEVRDEVVDIVHPDGTVIKLLSYASPLRDNWGKVRGAIAGFADITDRVRAEVEREQLLAREQRARAEAERANRAKDEFLAIVSHELRSPLNPILGWSKLLLDQKLDQAKTQVALSTIARNARLQAELIEDLLDVSRILRGKLSLNVAPVDLVSTIQAALETVRLSAEAKGIQIHTSLQSDVGILSGDSSRLQQIVWNLLSNAIKFTPQGGRVEVRLERVVGGNREIGEMGEMGVIGEVGENKKFTSPPTPSSQPSSPFPSPTPTTYAQITISDTGKGIAPNFLPHVFDYFRQEDGATTRKFGGLGLGLAIVHHLVELHGGTVTAESPGEGQGATFIVRLPMLSNSTALGQVSPLSETALDLVGMRILLVDDDADTREFVTFLLEEAGAVVTATASAGEALLALTRSRPDVLLSDIGMPDMDGYMLMRQVRALPSHKGGQVPAIALTAYAGEFDQKRALAVGFQQHIPKPVEPEILIRAISALLVKSHPV